MKSLIVGWGGRYYEMEDGEAAIRYFFFFITLKLRVE